MKMTFAAFLAWRIIARHALSPSIPRAPKARPRGLRGLAAHRGEAVLGRGLALLRFRMVLLSATAAKNIWTYKRFPATYYFELQNRSFAFSPSMNAERHAKLSQVWGRLVLK